MTNHHQLQLHEPAGLWNLPKVTGFLSLQLKTKWLCWFHLMARLPGGSAQGPAALLMAEGTSTGCRALTSWSREQGQPQWGYERVRAMHQLPALCQHAKVFLCQQLKPCQRAGGKPEAAAKPGSASSCHATEPSLCSTTILCRLMSQHILSHWSQQTWIPAGHRHSWFSGSIYMEKSWFLPRAGCALAVHHILGLTPWCWAGHKALPAPPGAELFVVFTASFFPVPLVHAGGENLLTLSQPWDSHKNHELLIPALCTNRGHREDGGWDMAALQPFHFHSISWAGFWAKWRQSWCRACCQLMNPTGFILDLCIWESSKAKAWLGSAQQVWDAVKYQRGAAAPEALLSLPSMDQLLRLDCKDIRSNSADWLWGNGNKPWIDCLNYRLWAADDHVPRAPLVLNASQDGDGGTHPWKMSMYWVPELHFEQCWWLECHFYFSSLLQKEKHCLKNQSSDLLLLLCMEERWLARTGSCEPAAKILTSLSLPCLTLCLPGREALSLVRMLPRQTQAERHFLFVSLLGVMNPASHSDLLSKRSYCE